MRPELGAMPRMRGWPRPVSAPSSLSASANPMLIPAPTLAANPTRNVSSELCVANAAANSGASVDTEPSISPASPGCTICSTNIRLRVSASSSRTCGVMRSSSRSAVASWVRSSAARSPSNCRIPASVVCCAALS